MTFTSPSKITEEKEKEIKKKDNCKSFCVTRKHNKGKQLQSVLHSTQTQKKENVLIKIYYTNKFGFIH